ARIAAPPEPADLLYAPDAGRAIEACVSARTLPHDRYHVVGHRSSLADLARALTAVDPEVRVEVESGGAAAGREPSASAPALPAMSTARIERDLGFRPEYDARRAAADYLGWLRARGEAGTP
ncbi:MAG TPA: hypothetical protein VIM86_00960, partial [Thermodesulfobacteriota bacterium]